jgi:hypothetical protein
MKVAYSSPESNFERPAHSDFNIPSHRALECYRNGIGKDNVVPVLN